MKATKKIPYSEERERKISGKQKKEVLQEARERKRDLPMNGDDDGGLQVKSDAGETHLTSSSSSREPRPPRIRREVAAHPTQEEVDSPPRVSDKVRMKRFAFLFN